MQTATSIGINLTFLGAYSALPAQVRARVDDFMTKFMADPTSPGINLEKINACQDKSLRSVRIDRTYRGIVRWDETSNAYVMLWVDHHDQAYEWARRRKGAVNAQLGMVQFYDTVEVGDDGRPPFEPRPTGLFCKYSDGDLKDIGVLDELIPLVRSLADPDELNARRHNFPMQTFEALSYLSDGIPLSEIVELTRGIAPHTPDMDNGQHSPEVLQECVFVDDNEELRRILDAPLESWRVFLHPVQRRVVEKDYSGPARVLGGAGTGKTVVALHRAKYLASTLSGDDRVLLTTFTANLTNDLRDNLAKICTRDELSRIDVINLDAWVYQFLEEHGTPVTLLYDAAKRRELWSDAISQSGVDAPYKAVFYEEEYNRVIVPQEAFTAEQYASARRTGRGTRLTRAQRLQIWPVFEKYIELMREREVRDIDSAMSDCRKIIASLPDGLGYRHVIVDEAQDFSTNALRLLRAIAGEEHPNDMFIVGDSHQRIYRNKAVLSRAGINIRGRSNVLHINYRTTEETRNFAFALLNGVSFDDLDTGIDDGERCRSLRRGPVPQVMQYDTLAEETAAVFKEVKGLVDGGVQAQHICIVARTHDLLKDHMNHFQDNSMRCYEIRGQKSDDQALDGVRFATMHRVKGLEFEYVFLVGANHDKIPHRAALDRSSDVTLQETTTAEKCLMYVALTRAQKRAYVSGYGKMSQFLPARS